MPHRNLGSNYAELRFIIFRHGILWHRHPTEVKWESATQAFSLHPYGETQVSTVLFGTVNGKNLISVFREFTSYPADFVGPYQVESL